MLAVTVDYEAKQAVVGTKAGSQMSIDEIFAALDAIGYRGELIEKPPGR